MFDLVVTGGLLVDGTGASPRRADIGIMGDTVVALGSLRGCEAVRVIDASGMVVSPGFIDAHGHSDAVLLCDRSYDAKLRQGVTTEVIGCCGMSLAPSRPESSELLSSYVSTITGGFKPAYSWRSFAKFLEALAATPLPNNVVPLVGHGTLRLLAMGFADRPATRAEVDLMCQMLEEAIEAGAYGLSSGLIYPPGTYAGTDELVALCQVVSSQGGLYSTHIRNESHRVREAVREAIDIGGRAEVPVVISHFKVMGRRYWGQVDEVLSLVDAAREYGQPVWVDQYPYTANSTLLNALLPPWIQAGGPAAMFGRLRDPAERKRISEFIEHVDDGSWENFVSDSGGWEGILVCSVPGRPEFEGHKVAELAARWNMEPVDALCRLLMEQNGSGAVVCFTMDEADVRTVMKHPATMLGSDGIPNAGKPHPRLYGTFPRVLGRYWREVGWLTLEEAIHKMTGLPALIYGLSDRGVLAEGKKADMVVFDPDEIMDTATYEEPISYPRGIRRVLLNGRQAVEDGVVCDRTAGRLLRRA